MTRWWPLLTFLAALSAFASHAEAHKASDSYLFLSLRPGGASGRWDIALRDLNDAIAIDADENGEVTWSEVQAAGSGIRAYAMAGLHARSETGSCQLRPGRIAVMRHSDGHYAAIDIDLTCSVGSEALNLRYDLLFELDAQHRGILQLGDAATPTVFTKASRSVDVQLERRILPALLAMVRLGTEHILHGYDHLLFLVALLLPCAWRREQGAWHRIASRRIVVRDVLQVVTAFSVAHSITLGLAAAHVLTLPTRLIESGIALSVVVAAFDNLYPLMRQQRWAGAFALGLLHGFGFAATLADARLSTVSFLRSLFGFNLGVELGQVAVVALLLPIIFLLSRSRRYPSLLLPLGSAVVMLIATAWLLERAFDLRIIS